MATVAAAHEGRGLPERPRTGCHVDGAAAGAHGAEHLYAGKAQKPNRGMRLYRPESGAAEGEHAQWHGRGEHRDYSGFDAVRNDHTEAAERGEGGDQQDPIQKEEAGDRDRKSRDRASVCAMPSVDLREEGAWWCQGGGQRDIGGTDSPVVVDSCVSILQLY